MKKKKGEGGVERWIMRWEQQNPVPGGMWEREEKGVQV